MIKKKFLFIFLLVQIGFAQEGKILEADRLAANHEYEKEIEVRKSILSSNDNKNSEDYKYQEFKLKLAEFNAEPDLDQALTKIDRAIEMYSSLKKKDELEQFDLALMRIDILMHQGNTDTAEGELLNLRSLALKKSEDRAWLNKLKDVLTPLMMINFRKGNYEGAIGYATELFEQAKEAHGYYSKETARAVNQIAQLYSYSGNYTEVINKSDEALNIYENIELDDPFLLFYQYAENFKTYKYYGDTNKLDELYKKMKAYYEKHKHNPAFINQKTSDFPNLNPVQTQYYYIQLLYATAYQQNDEAEKALMRFKKILPVGKVNYSREELNTVISYYLEIGSSFHRLGVPDDMEAFSKATNYYQEVIDFSKANDFVFGELQAYMMMGIIGLDYKQWDTVMEYSNLALNHPQIEIFNQTQTIEHNLGMALGVKKEYEKAFAIFDKQYQLYEKTRENSYSSIQNLTESGGLYLDLYDEDPKPEFLEKAYKNFHLASIIFSEIYRGGEFSARLYSYAGRINDGLLLSAVHLGKNHKETMERVEINHSDYLWSSYLKNRSAPLNETAENFRRQMDSLKMREIVLNGIITASKDEQKDFAELKKELENTRKNYDLKEKELKSKDHSFYQFSRTDFELGKIQKTLGEKDRILKFVLTDGSAYAYVVDNKEVKLALLGSKGPEIEKIALEYLSSLESIDKNFSEKSKNLYNELIKPLDLDGNTRLIIVPDGILSNIPFETLIDSKGNYLIENHDISYSYSLQMYAIQKDTHSPVKNRLAAFSPTYDLDFAEVSHSEVLKHLVRSGYYELIGAKEEAEKVSSIFKGDLFTGNRATKQMFLDKSIDYDILHLAMHAIVDPTDPNASGLIFQDDERLYLDELYQMKLPAHLAVLSACSTGSGNVKIGEGVQSLSRAFTYAGVQSTIMSLWPVPDRETSLIMTDFYENLKAGKPKDEALRRAKINYLKSVKEEELKHPYYWAGFVISGDISPLESSINLWWYIGGGIVLVSLLILYFRNRKELINS